MKAIQKLIEQLNIYKKSFPDEAETTDKFLEFTSGNMENFWRGFSPGHITASAWVLNHEKLEVLLTHHRRLNKWVQPGGHVEIGEDIISEARREAVEETGIDNIRLLQSEIFDLDIHAIPATAKAPEHFHYDVRYAFVVNGSHEYFVSDESHDLKWVDLKKVCLFTDEESVLRMVRKSRFFKS